MSKYLIKYITILTFLNLSGAFAFDRGDIDRPDRRSCHREKLDSCIAENQRQIDENNRSNARDQGELASLVGDEKELLGLQKSKGFELSNSVSLSSALQREVEFLEKAKFSSSPEVTPSISEDLALLEWGQNPDLSDQLLVAWLDFSPTENAWYLKEKKSYQGKIETESEESNQILHSQEKALLAVNRELIRVRERITQIRNFFSSRADQNAQCRNNIEKNCTIQVCDQ